MQADAATAPDCWPFASLQSPTDPIYGHLVADAAFVAAVKRQDVAQAAHAAAKTIKVRSPLPRA
jgi:hypothetical protein